MEFLIFIGGLIVGILIKDIKCGIIKDIEFIKELPRKEEYAQFFEPISAKERFEKSKNIDEFIEKL